MSEPTLTEKIADTLAYYQCRAVNPKADHPVMGYHAFSEDQRTRLRERQAEAAAEIARMIAAEVSAAYEHAAQIADDKAAAFGRPPINMDFTERSVAYAISQSSRMVAAAIRAAALANTNKGS